MKSAFGVQHTSISKRDMTNKEKAVAAGTVPAAATLTYAGGIPGAQGSQKALSEAFQRSKGDSTPKRVLSMFKDPKALGKLARGVSAGELGFRAKNHADMTEGWKNDHDYFEDQRKKKVAAGKKIPKKHTFEHGYAGGKIPAEGKVVRGLQRTRNKAQVGLAALGAGTAAYHINRKRQGKVKKSDSQLGAVKTKAPEQKRKKKGSGLATVAGGGIGGGIGLAGIGQTLGSSGKKWKKEAQIYTDRADKIAPHTKGVPDIDLRDPMAKPDDPKFQARAGKQRHLIQEGVFRNKPGTRSGDKALAEFAHNRGAAKNRNYFGRQYLKYGKNLKRMGAASAGVGGLALGASAIKNRKSNKKK